MRRQGFTLVELSIVLIIIGLIIGGIMKGRDLINSADQKKILNTWVKPWIVVANTYEDRTGSVLADSTANGGTDDTEDGRCDGKDLTEDTAVQDVVTKVGLDVPESNLPDSNGAKYVIKGKYKISTATLKLINRDNRNALEVNKVPSDVAMAWDTIIDGKVDGKTGNLLEYNKNDWQNAQDGQTERLYIYLAQ